MILLDPNARLVVGHRGASGEFPENTMTAFEQAIAQGADAIELDVRMSADGVPVVIHDATVDRTTNASGPVGAMTAAQLRALNVGAGEAIPPLRDVFARFGGVPMIIEVKEVSAARPVMQLLELFGMEQRVLLGSFEHAALSLFRVRGVPTSASRRETARRWMATRIGLAPRRHVYQAFTIPEWHGRVRVVDRRFVRAARPRGLPIHVWTVNDPRDAARLWKLGVNGVITNYPDKIKRR